MQTETHVIMMAINYSHDVATALLAASAAAMWLLSARFPADATPATKRYCITTYRAFTRIAGYSLFYILIAGVPRVIFYMQYEWSDLAGDLQIIAVAIKHVVMFLLVGTGICYWGRLGRRVKELEQERCQRRKA